MMETLVIKLGELFSGAGGLSLGAVFAEVKKGGEKYKIAPIWANDYDKDTCATYEYNLGRNHNTKLVCKDVQKIDYSILPSIDALAFGFPCNDFSIVGEQKGINGDFGPLYTYGIKAIKYFNPQWFLAENVGGLRSSNDGKTFQIILRKMRDCGYRIYPHLYKFEFYGVPQTRHRIIIIGIRNDIKVKFRIPEITTPEPMTCREAIENPRIMKDASNNEFTKQSEQVIERLKYIKPGENAFNAELPSHLKLNIKGAKISQIYKRLDPNKPSYTVTGSGGGGTHVYHWKENRALTNRERARLQTFPDDFVFLGSKESVRKQIGMAVPPTVAKIIFEAVLKSFACIEYDSIENNITDF
jgi:DNA (cytosine-5)-methyltransferase 1